MDNVIHPINYDLWHADKTAFAQLLGESFANTGFAVISAHTIPSYAIVEGLSAAKTFFGLPETMKTRYERPDIGFQRGYSPLGTESAKGRTQGDLKEFWHIGRPAAGHVTHIDGTRNLKSDDSASLDINLDVSLPTPSVTQVEGFDKAMQALFEQFDDFGAQILRAIALYLDLDEGWFDMAVQGGNSLLRLLHYPPQITPPEDGAVRAGAHEDINLITLLLGAEEAGLEVKHKTHGWIKVNIPHGAIVLNSGDMLQRLTGGVLPSTTHRVTNPSSERAHLSRYSMPFFLHPKNSFMLETLPSCIARGGKAHAPISAGDYLRERLIDIGLLTAA